MEVFAVKYTISALAACVSEITTYPLDMIKTRLQIQGQKGDLNHKTKYRGMMKTAVGIVKEEGFFRLWHGVPPALYRHFIYSGVRMTTYEAFRDALEKNPDGSLTLWKSVISGVVAGSLGQFLANPLDIVKVQIQMEGRRKLEGLPPRVHNTLHAVTKIVSEGGIRGLWKGWAPNVQRGALVNLGDLTTYDTSKHFFLNHTSLKDNYITHIISSVCSGLVAAVLGTPADTVKTRIMNQPTDSNGRGTLYKNSIDCMMKTIREEGFLAIYKGFIPCWTRMAPWSLTFWLSYEQLRKITGVTSF